MKCYIGETPSGLYDISRDKRPNTQCVECSNQDIQDFINIPLGYTNEIQQKINYILYASQLKLPNMKQKENETNNGERNNANV